MSTVVDPFKTKINTLDLGEKWTKMEQKKSSFEQEVSRSPVAVVASFLQNEKVTGVSFVPATKTISPLNAAAVQERLPNARPHSNLLRNLLPDDQGASILEAARHPRRKQSGVRGNA